MTRSHHPDCRATISAIRPRVSRVHIPGLNHPNPRRLNHSQPVTQGAGCVFCSPSAKLPTAAARRRCCRPFPRMPSCSPTGPAHSPFIWYAAVGLTEHRRRVSPAFDQLPPGANRECLRCRSGRRSHASFRPLFRFRARVALESVPPRLLAVDGYARIGCNARIGCRTGSAMLKSKVCGEPPNCARLCSVGRMLVEAAELAYATADSVLAIHLIECAMLAYEEEQRRSLGDRMSANCAVGQMTYMEEEVL